MRVWRVELRFLRVSDVEVLTELAHIDFASIEPSILPCTLEYVFRRAPVSVLTLSQAASIAISLF